MKYTLEQIETCCPTYTNFGEAAEQLENQLLKKCRQDKGIGLSANQIGLTDRVFVIAYRGKEYAAFNPSFQPIGDETIYVQEGCLSYPGLWLNIKRPAKVRAKWQDSNGIWHEADLEKMEARVWQHETDHLNGVPFIKKVSKIKLDRAIKARSKRVRDIMKSIR